MAQETGTGDMQGSWHFQWFHQRMPRREQRAQPLAPYQFDIDVHLQESSRHDWVLNSLIQVFVILLIVS